jgi:hypothetical protein
MSDDVIVTPPSEHQHTASTLPDSDTDDKVLFQPFLRPFPDDIFDPLCKVIEASGDKKNLLSIQEVCRAGWRAATAILWRKVVLRDEKDWESFLNRFDQPVIREIARDTAAFTYAAFRSFGHFATFDPWVFVTHLKASVWAPPHLYDIASYGPAIFKRKLIIPNLEHLAISSIIDDTTQWAVDSHNYEAVRQKLLNRLRSIHRIGEPRRYCLSNKAGRQTQSTGWLSRTVMNLPLHFARHPSPAAGRVEGISFHYYPDTRLFYLPAASSGRITVHVPQLVQRTEDGSGEEGELCLRSFASCLLLSMANVVTSGADCQWIVCCPHRTVERLETFIERYLYMTRTDLAAKIKKVKDENGEEHWEHLRFIAVEDETICHDCGGESSDLSSER